MAKIPKYMSLKFEKTMFTISIKKWGLPLLIFGAMRKFDGLKWYHWLLYPKICSRAFRGGLNGY